jgi:drug/metabolite transporter (DMT)-like permease
MLNPVPARLDPPGIEDRIAVRTDDPVRAALYLIGALALFSCSDLIGKILNATLSPIEIAWLRYVAFATLLVPPLLVAGPSALRTSRPDLQIVRGLGLLGSAILFVCATRFMPLAEATATGFMSPILITALSVAFLGERPGIRRWSAMAAGVAGMLIVVRPGTAAFQWAAGFALMSAGTWAFAIIATRRMSGRDRPLTMLIWSALTGLAVVSTMVPFVFVVPTPAELGLGLLAGSINAGAQFLTVMAYRHADASMLAPLSFLQLISAAALGYLALGSVPDLWTFLGAGVIASSSLYIAHRERAVARRTAQVQ